MRSAGGTWYFSSGDIYYHDPLSYTQMKYFFYILILAGLLAPAVHAQAPAARVEEAARWQATARLLSDRVAATGRSPYIRPDLVLHQAYDGTSWVVEGQTIFAYEGIARKEEWTYVRDGEALYNATRITYQVAAADEVAALTEAWDRDAAAFMPVRRELNLFDANQVREGVRSQEWNGTAWVDVERTRYAFTMSPFNIRIISGATTEVWDGTAWTPVERYGLVEEAGDVVETTEAWDGTAWVNAERVRYPGQTLGSLHDLLVKLQDELADYGDLNLALRYIPPQLRQRWDGTAWADAEQVVWEAVQMPGSEPALILHQVWDGDGWVSEARQEILYEQEGSRVRPTQLALQVFGGTWMTVLQETYQYDGAGNLVKAEQQLDVGSGLEDYAWYTIRWKHLATGVEDDETPGAYALSPAYPNPFNPATTLTYRLSAAGPVSVQVYDALGRQVATLFEGMQVAGTHAVTFEAAGLPSGLYLVRLAAPGFQQTRRVTLMK